MVRGLLLCVVMMASAAVAAAQPPVTLSGQLSAPATTATATAEVSATLAERRVVQLSAQRSALAKRYQDELAEIDSLKKQRPSWRRDRELRDNLSSSLETANQLTATTRELAKAQQNFVIARRAYLTAVENELMSGPNPRRRIALDRVRRVLGPQTGGAPRRIVLPDLEIDLLADPEELDQRAAELRATEDELAREATGLAAHAKDLEHLAQLRKQHDRAGDLFNRDDDQPHRATMRKPNDSGPPPEDPAHSPVSPGSPVSPTSSSSFDYVPLVLGDVLDASTLSTFAAAERSGDPAQRAVAARRAHDAVARRVDEVRKRRADIEARARLLRSAP